MTPSQIRVALAPWADAHRRTAWRPRLVAFAGLPKDSRFGGRAWLPDGVPPCCGRCKEPMPLLLQVDLGSAPGGLGTGLLQAFYCANSDCEQACDGWGPFSAAHLVRIVDPAAGNLADARPTDHRARAIVGWTAFDDFPHAEDHEEAGLETEYDFVAKTISFRCERVGLDSPPVPIAALPVEEVANAVEGDKLLGWPAWVQGAEYPSCRECGARMRVLFQLDSEAGVPFMWGDLGIAHISQCVTHPAVLTLAWACS